jgi:hypothetical protein
VPTTASDTGSGAGTGTEVTENVTLTSVWPCVVRINVPGVGSKPVKVSVPLPETDRLFRGLPLTKLKLSDATVSVVVAELFVAVYSWNGTDVAAVKLVIVAQPVQVPNTAKEPVEAPMLAGLANVMLVAVKLSVPFRERLEPAAMGTAIAADPANAETATTAAVANSFDARPFTRYLQL